MDRKRMPRRVSGLISEGNRLTGQPRTKWLGEEERKKLAGNIKERTAERKADCILLSIHSYRTETMLKGDKKCSTIKTGRGHDIMASNNICAKSGVTCTPFHMVSLADVYLPLVYLQCFQWLRLCSTETWPNLT
jgi:hypothetical protein